MTKKYDANTEVGKQITIPLPSVNFWTSLQPNMARQVIYSRVREAEKSRQFNELQRPCWRSPIRNC